ncbi:MerR family transcriptional regulator [Pseudonocardia xinjiangensis]|uniref:MerR family transcriptional regulator n=1 Tax=Pseudonocardia xinjiangensis TaxID=75289 RepID=UPI003D8F9F4E
MSLLAVLAIGDFSRATHMSIKVLRHYHRIGLLKPADVDPVTGYRRYTTDQIPTAQVIRRFRGLDMPLEEIRAVLTAPDVSTRNRLISAHLTRLEDGLVRTQRAVDSLRDLLETPVAAAQAGVGHRSVEDTPAAAITEVVDLEDALTWYQGALGELHATLAAQRAPVGGAAGGIFSDGLFQHERGEATIFLPCARPIRAMGRVTDLVVPAAELATVIHDGPHLGIDRAYGTLAAHVAQHAVPVNGPIREYYITGRHETTDESEWRTEIGWPVFQTATGAESVVPQGPDLVR